MDHFLEKEQSIQLRSKPTKWKLPVLFASYKIDLLVLIWYYVEIMNLSMTWELCLSDLSPERATMNWTQDATWSQSGVRSGASLRCLYTHALHDNKTLVTSYIVYFQGMITVKNSPKIISIFGHCLPFYNETPKIIIDFNCWHISTLHPASCLCVSMCHI